MLRRERDCPRAAGGIPLEVSRQSVSKWEADKTMPEISKLIAISELFQVSLDYLLNDDCENQNGRFPGMEDVPDYSAGKGPREAVISGGSRIADSGKWMPDGRRLHRGKLRK